MKIREFFKWLIGATTFESLSIFPSGSSGSLPGDWRSENARSENALREEFKDFPLSDEIVYAFNHTLALHIKAVTSQANNDFIQAIDEYIKLQEIKLSPNQIGGDLLNDSITVLFNYSKLLRAFEQGELANRCEQRISELERMRANWK